MTWLILIFTWFLTTISDQWDKWFCTAYSVATCASVYWVKEDWLKIAQKELFLTFDWFPEWLVALKRFNISYQYTMSQSQLEEKLMSWPLLVIIPSWVKIDWIELRWYHETCLVGQTKDDLIIANSWWKKVWVEWYQRISKSDIPRLSFQDFGTWNLIARNQVVKQEVKEIKKKTIKRYRILK